MVMKMWMKNIKIARLDQFDQQRTTTHDLLLNNMAIEGVGNLKEEV